MRATLTPRAAANGGRDQRDARFYIYAPALEDRANEILQTAGQKHLRIATAESCTGGALAALLTDVEGFSHVFERGFVVYSEAAKTDCLGVRSYAIAAHGAVSRPVAEAMARGALDRSRADVAIAITGNAGPAAPDDEPGLVFLCAAARDGRLQIQECHFGNIDRSQVRIRAIETALQMLSLSIDSTPAKATK
jgi:nicotinamide-nucleotide amidase